jgi:PBSX family phage terminase large subunit
MTTVEHRYTPQGAAQALFAYRGDEVILSGPAGTGKSLACLEKLHALALMNPGMRGLVIRKTQVSMTNTALVTFTSKVIPEAIKAGLVHWYGGSAQEAAGYRYSNGSVINVGGMDKPTKVMSSDYDAIYVQEAIELTEADWDALTTRLRNGKITFQQLFGDTNPDTEVHWLNQRCNAGKTTKLESRHEDNPVLWDAIAQDWTERGKAYIGKLDNLTGVRFLRLRKGLWVAAEGMVYEDWDPTIHLIDRFVIPQSWERIWAVDFGFKHPFVLQCWARDHDGRLFRYREIFMTNRLVEDHARTILDIVAPGGKWIEPRPTNIICDHDAEDRATLEKHLGLGTIPARKTKSDGIQAVQARFRVAEDGKPRIAFLRDSLVERDQLLVDAKKPTCTEEEIPGYVWNPEKDEPVKRDDDGCDTTRYAVADSDLGARLNVRWLE